MKSTYSTICSNMNVVAILVWNNSDCSYSRPRYAAILYHGRVINVALPPSIF